jgi:SAM-dependent methyltransferase
MQITMNDQPHAVTIFEVASPENFDEQRYVSANKDVRTAIETGSFVDGWQHFKKHGRKERRKQYCDDYLRSLRVMRERKLQRIATILREDIDIAMTPDGIYDYRGGDRKETFGFSETANISSNAYDELPLGVIRQFPHGLILDCGAGYRPEYYENVVNYEIVPYQTTDVLGFAEDLPFADESFDAVFSFAVLEHVKYPFIAADELCRVLKPGGILAAGAAFLQPIHGYPHHYFNMTNLGLRVLFEESIDITRQFVNPGTGPMVALSWFLREWMKNLPAESQKKFRKLKVADILAQPPEAFSRETFVADLSEEANFQLACATRMIGQKRIKVVTAGNSSETP